VSGLHFEPPFPLSWLIPLALCLVAIGIVIRLVAGPPASPARRRPLLLACRSLTILGLLFVLSGPTWIDGTPGEVARPDLFFVLDSSKSMDIGKDRSRWADAAAAIDAARHQISLEEQTSIHQFRFGHRLEALPPDQQLAALQPNDSDSRLAEALRQLTGRFGRRPPAALVLFSDGQARDTDDVRELAHHYAKRKIPIHVYPPPAAADRGDVAIVAAVVPRRVRKFSDVEVQAFLRSGGFAGQRSEVSLVVPGSDGKSDEILASVPISLKGGVQSVPLMYRSDMKGRTFEIRVAEMPDEVSTRNNVFPIEVDVERPKIRVLYIDGSPDLPRLLQTQTAPNASPTRAPVQNAMTADEDIECAVLIRNGRQLTKPANTPGGTTFRFPTTQAELSAFDCIILSNVPANLINETQQQWLKHWVENRGGGLLMAGGPDSFAAGGWQTTPLVEMLPVTFDKSQWRETGEGSVHVSPVKSSPLHPIWQIIPEQQPNLAILDQIPPFPAMTSGLLPKPAAEVLATEAVAPVNDSNRGADSAEPLVVVGRYGRGRAMAVAWQLGPPDADAFMKSWGAANNKNVQRFWRNVVYWLSESSSIGRRRLVADVNKRFYRPGEPIQLKAVAFSESALRTTDYHIWGMIEPKSFELIGDDLFAPIRWPQGVKRDSGEQAPRIVWGEEFELPRDGEAGEYRLTLDLTERLSAGMSDQGFRIELTAYEGEAGGFGSHGTQVDSTSVDVQVLDDPFEQQNTSANQELLSEIAATTGGQILTSPSQLTKLVSDLPIEVGPSTLHRTPMWSNWWLLGLMAGALSLEWLVRRMRGLA
jgi:uncharacterized membrane protein